MFWIHELSVYPRQVLIMNNIYHFILEEDDDEFGFIIPTLIKQLQGVLGQYPDDGQILKVMLYHSSHITL